MSKFYAGIGARDTPAAILAVMQRLAKSLLADNWTLRSGGAAGADRAFESGAGKALESFLPRRESIPMRAFEIAKEHHPAWGMCSVQARTFLARNSQIILGAKFDNPVRFVAFWKKNSTSRGGTTHSLRVAKSWNIPLLDFGKVDGLGSVEAIIAGHCDVNSLFPERIES